MTELSSAEHDAFEAIRQADENDAEFWSARDLAKILGYEAFRNFQNVIAKAITACENTGGNPDDHFVEFDKVITAGKGAQLSSLDYALSRYACYSGEKCPNITRLCRLRPRMLALSTPGTMPSAKTMDITARMTALECGKSKNARS
jgi:hypothetical protein